MALRYVNNRRREPWVLEGLSSASSVARRASKEILQPSLELLGDQKTGDNFLPKRWLDATLGGHSSKEVAYTVRAFLGTARKFPSACGISPFECG